MSIRRKPDGSVTARSARALASVAFLLLASWAILRSAAAGLLAADTVGVMSPVKLRASAALGQALVLMLLAPAVLVLARRVPKLADPAWLSASLGLQLLVWGVVESRLDLTGSGFFLFLWSGSFGVAVPASFWALVARPGLRHEIPRIALASSAGAVAGSWLVGALSPAWSAGDLLLVAGALMAAASVVLHAGQPRTDPLAANIPQTPASAWQASSRSLSVRATAAIAITTLLIAWAQTNAESVLFGLVADGVGRSSIVDSVFAETPVADRVAAFYGRMHLWTGLLALAVQAWIALGLAPRGRFGAAAFLILPVLTLVSASLLACAPLLGLAGLVRIAERATKHSLHQTARQLVWLPLSQERIRWLSPVVETLAVRSGDALGGLTVLGALTTLGESIRPLLVLNVALAVVSVGAAASAVHFSRRMATRSRRARSFEKFMDAGHRETSRNRALETMAREPQRVRERGNPPCHTDESERFLTTTAPLGGPALRRSSSWSSPCTTAAAPRKKLSPSRFTSSRNAA